MPQGWHKELIGILEKFGLKVKMFAVDAKMYLQITDDIVAQLQQLSLL